MTIKQAAERVHKHFRTIERWISTGRLRTTMVWSDSGLTKRHDIDLYDLIDAADADVIERIPG